MVNLLMLVNSGSLLNGMDILIFSLPLEFSPLVNFNLLIALKKMLKEAATLQQISFRRMNDPRFIAKR
jgi:hypothetical protein